MAIYSLSLNTTVTTTGASAQDIIASAANSPRVMEIAANLGAATSSTYGIGRAGNTPVQTSTTTLQAENPSDPAGQTKAAVTWSSAPTVPAAFFRRITLPATIGAGIIWTFPRGLVLAASAALEFWNLAVNSANTNVWWVVDE
jgi:hypothetical protein